MVKEKLAPGLVELKRVRDGRWDFQGLTAEVTAAEAMGGIERGGASDRTRGCSEVREGDDDSVADPSNFHRSLSP